MAVKTVGELIKEARTNAKLSQAALGEQVGVSASDIGKAERGEKELSQTVLKAIAKATGVTQKSLLEAPKAAAGSAAKKTTTSAKKTTTTAKKTTGSSAKKPASTAKTPAASSAAEELTAAEKTLLNAYRKADAETRKAALKLLKGEKDEDILSTLIQNFMGGGSGGAGGDLGGTLMNLLGSFGKK